MVKHIELTKSVQQINICAHNIHSIMGDTDDGFESELNTPRRPNLDKVTWLFFTACMDFVFIFQIPHLKRI